MFSRRIAMAILVAMLTSALTVAPAAAAKPTKPPASPPAPTEERPLTHEEEAASDAKIAAANAYIAGIAASGSDLATLSCVTPTAVTDAAVTDAAVTHAAATEATTDATTQACYTPQGFLAVEARDQLFGNYCAPATGQVIANYTWAMGAGQNKYRQQDIATWMGTGGGGTTAPSVAAGLERATKGAPRRPAIWSWVVSPLSDSNGDGTAGGELHGFVRANVSGSRMPLAVPVKPHDPNSRYYLVSWPKPVLSPGHWIAAYGWVGLWTGTDYARLYYTDSSRDEGGSTGKFWDPMRHIAALIMEHTKRFVW